MRLIVLWGQVHCLVRSDPGSSKVEILLCKPSRQLTATSAEILVDSFEITVISANVFKVKTR